MAPTRVLRIIARMNVGGPAVEIAELMRGLDPAQFEQRLLTGYCADDEADFLEKQAPDVAAVRIPELGRSIRTGDDVRSLRRLVREIREFDPDVIHTHTAKAGVLGRVAARSARSRARVIHTHHGHLLHGYFGPAKTQAVVQVERSLARVTDTLITVGAKVRDDLLAAHIGRPEQYRVIYSGVRIGELPSKELARAELGLPPDRVIVSIVGRLTGIKRPDRFLDVVRTTRQQLPEAHFAVAGWGDLGGSTAATVAAENLPVTMLGWRDDLERVLAATDIIILTSDNEGTPLSLVQAGLAGIPSVATNVGAVSEVVRSGETGLLTAPTSAHLSTALTTLVLDPQMRATMGEAARQRARDRFSIDRFIHEHAAVYGTI